MEKKVVIDESKCIGCGLCVKDCTGCDIEIVNGKALAHGASCILCGHCEAVCPQNAVTVTGYDDEPIEFETQTRLNPDELMAAIKTRRTIRQFTDAPVPQEIIDMIIEAGRMTPTGANSQGTHYIMLNDKRAECEAIAVGMFGKALGLGKKFIPALGRMDIHESFFFKKAPVVIVITGKDKVSASLAAQSMAFMAEANGLGVLFSGFFTTCFNLSGKIRRTIGVSKKPKAVTTMVMGYPAVKYHRTIRRNPANIIEA